MRSLASLALWSVPLTDARAPSRRRQRCAVFPAGNTKAVWFYDMRTNIPAFGKRTPLTKEHFQCLRKCMEMTPMVEAIA